MLMLAKIMNTVYTGLFLGNTLFESLCLNIFVCTTGLRAIEYAEMLSQSSSSKGNKRLLPLPAPVPRRRIAIDPDIDGGDEPIADVAIDLPAAEPIAAIELPAAEPIADDGIDQGDPDIDGDDEGGGVGEYPEFILGAKV